jgi:tRNA(Ile2) C34 agmatinyltransferase TiaS
MDHVPSVYNEVCPDCGGRLESNGFALVCVRCPYCRPAQDSSKTLPVVTSNQSDYCPDCGGKLLYNGLALVCIRCPYCRPAQDSSQTIPAMPPARQAPKQKRS